MEYERTRNTEHVTLRVTLHVTYHMLFDPHPSNVGCRRGSVKRKDHQKGINRGLRGLWLRDSDGVDWGFWKLAAAWAVIYRIFFSETKRWNS